MELRKVKLSKLIPYENNPRVNDHAVDAVAHSIQEVGYISPIVVDEQMNVLAGHTRLKALKSLGGGVDTDVEVYVADGLTEAQKSKYRLLDNKTSEFSLWDFDALREESEGLDFSFDFGIDDLLEKGAQDKIEKEKAIKPKSQSKICTCPRCNAQWEE